MNMRKLTNYACAAMLLLLAACTKEKQMLPAKTTLTSENAKVLDGSTALGIPYTLDFDFTTKACLANFSEKLTVGTFVKSRVWDFGDGTTAYAPKTSHEYHLAGTYSVKLTVNIQRSGKPDTTLTKIKLVSIAPVASFGSIQSPSKPNGFYRNFYDYSTIPDVTTCEWDFGDGLPSTKIDLSKGAVNGSTSYYYSIQTGGDYNVTMTLTTKSGSKYFVTEVVKLPTDLIPDFGYGYRVGYLVDFSDLSKNGNTICTWNFGDGSAEVTDTYTSHTFPAKGTYNVTMTAMHYLTGTRKSITKAVIVE